MAHQSMSMKKGIFYGLFFWTFGYGQNDFILKPNPAQAELDFKSGLNTIPTTNTKSSFMYLVDINLDSLGQSGPKSIRELRYPSDLTSWELFKKSKEQFDQILTAAISVKHPATLGEIEFATYFLLEFYMLAEPGNEKKVEYYLEVLMKLPHPSDLESIAKAYLYSEGALNPALRNNVEKYLRLKIKEFLSFTPKDGYSTEYIEEHEKEAIKAIAVLNLGRK